MLIQRPILMHQSKEDLCALTALSVVVYISPCSLSLSLSPSLARSPESVMVVIHTRRLKILQGLIMSSTKLRPFRKLILRAGIVHVAFQLEDFALEAICLAALLGYRGR